MEEHRETKELSENSGLENLEGMVLSKLLVFNAVTTGLVTGLLLGSIIFFATIFLILKGGSVVGPHLALLGQYFIGYEVSFVGSLVGFAYGMITGFIMGYVCSSLYNKISQFRHTKKK